MLKIGQILISQPNLPEFTYRNCVIMICEINSKGIIGLILNRPGNTEVRRAFANIRFKSNIYFGGPIRSNYVSFIHACKGITGGIPITDEISWGGEPQSLSKVFLNNFEDKTCIRFYSGFTGWEKGDLESELNNNYWWKSTISPEELFTLNADLLYGYLLKREQIRCEIFRDNLVSLNN